MMKVVRTTLVLFLLTSLLSAAGIDGTWDFAYDIGDSVKKMTTTFKTDGEKLMWVEDGQDRVVGVYKKGEYTVKIPDYYSEEGGYKAALTLKGKVSGDKITGEWMWDTYSGTFTGTRVK